MSNMKKSATKGAHTLAATLLASTIFTPLAYAQDTLPTGGKVVSGSASIQRNGLSMQIDQSSDKLIANWRSFSIGKDNKVIFNQPNAQSIALNRVIGQDPSRILGDLIANGKVFLVNPNGIVIGKGGSVQAGGFVGSTLGVSDNDFLNDQLRFTGTGGYIFNAGDLKGSVVALISPTVLNGGTITGSTALAAGTDVTIDFDGDGLIAVEVSASSMQTLVHNSGLIKADGGIAILTARGASDAMKGVVNNTGVVEANSLQKRNGRILLLGDMNHGEVNVAGSLSASFVETSAAGVNIDDRLVVDTDGGHWLIDPNDFTIAASGGNISGTALSNNLANGNVTITTASQGTPGGNGDIFVNDTVTWSSNILTLNADRNIEINTEMFGSGTAGLALEYAQTDPEGDYFINAPVNLASTGSFSTKRGSDDRIDYVIITELGNEDSSDDGTLQGILSQTDYFDTTSIPTSYVLGANIDASNAMNWNSGAGFNPIDIYQGKFDGLGHQISNLTIKNIPTIDEFGGIKFPFGNDGGKAGLFASVDGGSIRNLSLIDVDIAGGSFVGGLAGEFLGASVSNVRVTGRVEGRFRVGGLVGLVTADGSQTSMIENVSVNAVVAGISDDLTTGDSRFVGGLAGDLSSGSILQKSYFEGSVEGLDSVGGLVGINAFSLIKESWTSGTVAGRNMIGGLVGENGPETTNCSPPSCSPGDRPDRGSTIEDSYSVSDVSGAGIVGGIAGIHRNDQTLDGIRRTFFSGSVTASGDVGALVGFQGGGQSSTVSSSFWNTETAGVGIACDSGQSCSSTTRGLTTAEMKDPANFIAAGWDFDNVWDIDPDINEGYPHLRATVLQDETPTPPPPPPPPEPDTPLTLDDFGDFSTMEVPFQPTIALMGSGFSDVTEIRFTFTDPNGDTGTVIWNAANNFGDGRFIVDSDTNASIMPILVAANDPTGTYQWSVTLVAGDQSVTQNFSVSYTQAMTPTPSPTPVPTPSPSPTPSPTPTPISGEPILNVNPDDPPGRIVWGLGFDGGGPEGIDPTFPETTPPTSPEPLPITTFENATPEQLQAAEDYWELALLSNNVYHNGNEFIMPPGWVLLDVNDDVNGFYAEAWLKTDAQGNTQIVMVFRGTQGITNLPDNYYGNLTGAQEAIARDYARFVANTLLPDHPGATVTATGHSLGGALAKVAADELGTTAVVFNSSPKGPDNGNVVYIEETGDFLDAIRLDDDGAVSYNFTDTSPGDSHSIYTLAHQLRSLAKSR